MKAYVGTWKLKERLEVGIDYTFCSNPDGAACWQTRQEAESDCVSIFERQRIVLEGSLHILSGFQVEEHGKEFVVFCEGPFVLRH